MKGIRRRSGIALAALAVLAFAAPAPGIFVARAPGRNLDPPAEADAGPEKGGWSYTGAWGKFPGTSVSRRHFLTARHVGGRIGGRFYYRGERYFAVGRYDVPHADLTLWQVDRDLPEWAPLYDGTDEVGKVCYVFGRGVAPGSLVSAGGRPIGWTWGPSDNRQSWGRGRIATVTRDPESGESLASPFTPDGCSLSTGDSGGGVFLWQNGRWRLAGICRSVEKLWSLEPDGRQAFAAGLVDGRGLYRPASRGWVRVAGDRPVPTHWFATRLAPHRAFLDPILAAPPGPDWFRVRIGVGAAGAAMLVGVGFLVRRIRRKRSATAPPDLS